MKRLHVNTTVADLDASISFYSSLFGTKPTVHKPDYAKWLIDDPRVNFAITSRGSRKGINHLGIQVDSAEELAEIEHRLEAAAVPLFDRGATTCCYAQSEKHWSRDPQGIAWETFLTTGESDHHSGTDDVRMDDTVCCDRPPRAESAEVCCSRP